MSSCLPGRKEAKARARRRSAVRSRSCPEKRRAGPWTGPFKIRPVRKDRPYNVSLVYRLTRTAAPTEAVLRTMQRDHADAVILRVATGAARDNDVVTGFQRFSGNALTPELTSAAPFHGVAHHRSILLLHHHVHERVRISKQELHQLTLDRHRLVLQVGGGKGVMGVSLRANEARCRDQADNQQTLHSVVPPLTEPVLRIKNRSRQTPELVLKTL